MTFQFELNSAKPLSTELSIDEEFHRTYKTKYLIWTERTASPFFIDTQLPDYGSSYEWYGFIDLWAFCRGYEIGKSKEIKDPITGDIIKQWEVTATHTSKPSKGSNDNKTKRDNPLKDQPIFSGSFQNYLKIKEEDKDGNPIINTALDPYTPPVEINEALDTITFQFNTASLSLEQRASMINKVNSNNMWGLERRRIKMTVWDYEVLRAGNNFEYVKNTITFEISFYKHPQDPKFVAIGEAGKVGFYTTLPNVGESFYVGGRDLGNPDDEVNCIIAKPGGGITTKPMTRAECNELRRRKFADKDESNFKQRKLRANGGKQWDGAPMLWNVYEVEEEADFSEIRGLPTILPGPIVYATPE